MESQIPENIDDKTNLNVISNPFKLNLNFGTEGALRRPMTYDNHPIHPPKKPLESSKQTLDWSELTSDDLRWTKMY